MSRFLLTVMLAVGLALSACTPPENSAGEGSGNKQRAEKPAKEEQQTKEEPPDKERPKPDAEADDKKKEKPKEPKKPASKPKPAPSKPKPAPSDNAQESRRRYDATVKVAEVVDGDTIKIYPAVKGNYEVRLIGVDTPETKHPSEEVEPMGPEASSFATDELAGKRVGLEFDVEREDQYDRLLAYVYLVSEMFNQTLVEEGYAQASPYPPNTRYEERFAAAQEEARAAELGIWGLTLAQQCQLANHGNGIGEGSPGCAGASASASTSASASASSSAGAGGSAPAAPGGGGDIDCDQVNGPIPTPPGDPDGLDGDGDGLACE